MPAHFLGLKDARVLATRHYQLTGRIIDDLIGHRAIGVVHGPAGAGKTFAVEAHLEKLRGDGEQIVTASLAFASHPTPREVARRLVHALTGVEPAEGKRDRFQLTSRLLSILTYPERLLVVDEAQQLNANCIQLIRHLHDHEATRFAVLLVGGDGCWEVLKRDPMLASRIFRRLPFAPLRRDQIPALIRDYHLLYRDADPELLYEIDDAYAHGNLRDWAVFTLTAAALSREAGQPDVLTPAVMANAYTLLGAGIDDDAA